MSEMQQNPSTSIPALTLGWRLQMAMAHAGLTTEGMAAEIGVTRSTISRWVNEHGAPPRTGFVKLWALRCGVPYEWLATGMEPEQSPDGPGTQAEPSLACVTAADSDSEAQEPLPDNVRPLRQSPARTTRSNPALPLSA